MIGSTTTLGASGRDGRSLLAKSYGGPYHRQERLCFVPRTTLADQSGNAGLEAVNDDHPFHS